jgi:phosphoglycerol transferase MdoB-like AlkP superfamily enzyme
MKTSKPRPLLFLLTYYGLVLAFFTLCRVVVLLQNFADFKPVEKALLPKVFRLGAIFDTVMISYVILLPFLLLTFLHFVSRTFKKGVRQFLNIYLSIALVLYFMFSMVDIGYFDFYGTRLNSGVFSWMGSPWLIVKTLVTDYHYWIYIVLTIIAIWGIFKVVSKLNSCFLEGSSPSRLKVKPIISTIIFALLLFTGLRGSLDFENRPLEPKAALFSPYALVNNITVNGVFNLVHNLSNRDIDFLTEEDALKWSAEYLGFEPTNQQFPLAHHQMGVDTAQKKNVVLVIMESMSADQTGLYGSNKGLTPFLDSLAKNSICFPNIYTSGVHTHNGLYSTLYSHPAILDRVGIREGALANLSYYGLPHILKEKGYNNTFLITGDGNFDSMIGFFPENGFDKFVSQDDFPKSDRTSSWGVSDHVLFNKTMHIMDSEHATNTPFFMSYMTISTHTPWTLPKDDRIPPLKGENMEDRSYAYADWSIKQFLEQAKLKPWYNNTIFAFVADHGQRFNIVYDMPLAYHHTPFIIFDPSVDTVSWNDKIGLQIDVFPTLMSYLGFEFENNTLGTDLFTQTRPYAYFSADDKIGILDSVHFYVENINGHQALYRYKDKSVENELLKYPEKVSEMQQYAYSMLQSSIYAVENRVVGKPSLNQE